MFLFEDHTNSQNFLRFCLSSRSGFSSAMSSARPMRRRLPYRVWRCLTESGHSPLKLTAETHEKMASQKEMNTLRFKFPIQTYSTSKKRGIENKTNSLPSVGSTPHPGFQWQMKFFFHGVGSVFLSE